MSAGNIQADLNHLWARMSVRTFSDFGAYFIFEINYEVVNQGRQLRPKVLFSSAVQRSTLKEKREYRTAGQYSPV